MGTSWAHGLEGYDQWADSGPEMGQRSHLLRSAFGSKVHLWEFVLPFLALFFLDSAAPAHGTLVPTGCPWGGAWHQGTQVTGEDEGPHGPLQEPRGKVIAEGKFQVLGGGGCCPALTPIAAALPRTRLPRPCLCVQNSKDGGRCKACGVYRQHHTKPKRSSGT